MKTETLKISLVQRILGISDTKVLKKINQLLNAESIVGYAGGKPVSEEEYIRELDAINKEIDDKTAKTFTTDQVKNRIINAHNLAQQG